MSIRKKKRRRKRRRRKRKRRKRKRRKRRRKKKRRKKRKKRRRRKRKRKRKKTKKIIRSLRFQTSNLINFIILLHYSFILLYNKLNIISLHVLTS